MSYLEIQHLSHAYADRSLYRDSGFSLYKGEHVGVVGSNGAGKSTLIQICTGEVIPDEGSVRWQPQMRCGHLGQYAQIAADTTIEAFLHGAFEPLYALQRKMLALYDRAGDDAALLTAAAQCQARLEAQDFYAVDVRIEKVAAGLGLHAVGLDRPLRTLSGGQRAKVILGKLLLEDPDVLLLDEPTNFLDKEHVQWLAATLRTSTKAFLVVSHDHGFLEQIADHILDVDEGVLRKYTGSYADFLKQKEHLRADYLRRYQTQQREIAHTEEYIRKNIAGNNSKNAKGRRKQLQRVERLAPPEVAQAQVNIHFQPLPTPTQAHLQLRRLSVGYDFPLLQGLSFSVHGGQKVVLTGFNGIGKSTLLKTLTGLLPPLVGSFHLCQPATIGYYAQDLCWEEPAATPLETVRAAFPALSGKQARRELSRCGISAQHAMQALDTLSGGEQAKVKLCLLTCQPCNFLILDEPTNHLDAAAKQALQAALAAFPGTVLLVSHEPSFYRGWTDRTLDMAAM